MNNEQIEHIMPSYTDILAQYESAIYKAIDDFCIEQNIEDIKKESQSVFNGLLRYIGKTVFYDRDKLKDKTNIYINNNINIHSSNFNRYNYDLIEQLANIYYNIAFNTNHEISIIGLSFFLNLQYQLIYSWLNEKENNVSSKSSDIAKNTLAMNEESLANKLYSSGGNSIGTIAILNHRFNWSTAKVEHISGNNNALTAHELPKLSAQNSHNLQVVQSDDENA